MAGTIANYGELKQAAADWAKRRDLTDVMDIFVRRVHIRLQEYVGPLVTSGSDPDEPVYTLENDTDSNALLNYDPYAYLYGTLVEIAGYLRDPEMMGLYQSKYSEILADLAMSGYDRIDATPNGAVV
jgi:hypothetical protein